MKHIFESIAVTLVVVFSIAIIILIVQYNLIEEADNVSLRNLTTIEKKSIEKEKKSNYLDALEKYRDKNVNVNPKVDSRVNQVKVKIEELSDKKASLPKDVNDIGSKIDALLYQ